MFHISYFEGKRFNIEVFNIFALKAKVLTATPEGMRCKLANQFKQKSDKDDSVYINLSPLLFPFPL